MSFVNLISKLITIDSLINKYGSPSSLILNVGSGETRYGESCINIDIQHEKNVDIVADAHCLPFRTSSFDLIIICAVLQYCEDPRKVIKESERVLTGGVALVDAPFIQQYCPDTPDLYRFTKIGLEKLFNEGYELLESEVSIAGGSALAFYCQGLTYYTVKNKLLRGVLVLLMSIFLYPLSFVKFRKRHEVAGAFVVAARKKSHVFEI